MRKIKKIIVHCSATKASQDITVQDVRRWHKSRGWSDIGYHYFIDIHGAISIGRPIYKQGAHVKGHNSDSVGICYAGGVDSKGKPKDTLTKPQRDAIQTVIDSIRVLFGSEITIHGHNEFANKACPSFKVEKHFS